MPRFVILTHAPSPSGGKPLHWDLMLESEEGLLTWALDQEPAVGSTVIAQRLPLHRLAYLDYEGEISNDRGTVTRWDEGEFAWLNHANPVAVRLAGRVLVTDVTIESELDTYRCVVRFGPSTNALE